MLWKKVFLSLLSFPFFTFLFLVWLFWKIVGKLFLRIKGWKLINNLNNFPRAEGSTFVKENKKRKSFSYLCKMRWSVFSQHTNTKRKCIKLNKKTHKMKKKKKNFLIFFFNFLTDFAIIFMGLNWKLFNNQEKYKEMKIVNCRCLWFLLFLVLIWLVYRKWEKKN